MTDGPKSVLSLFKSELEKQMAKLEECLTLLQAGFGSKESLSQLVMLFGVIKASARINQLKLLALMAEKFEFFFSQMSSGVMLDEEKLSLLSETHLILGEICTANVEMLRAVVESKKDFISSSVKSLETWIQKTKEPIEEVAKESVEDAVEESLKEVAEESVEEVVEESLEEVAEKLFEESSIDVDLLPLFILEAEEHITTLSEGLLHCEEDIENPRLFEPLMRAAHSLKGAARVVNITPLVSLMHLLEECFIEAQKKNIQLDSNSVDVIFTVIDLVASLREIPIGHFVSSIGDKVKEIHNLENSLMSILQKAEIDMSSVVEKDVKSKKAPLSQKFQTKAKDKDLETGKKLLQDRAKDLEMSVKISATSLNQLMGLAGETLVESRWFKPYNQSLIQLKRNYDKMCVSLNNLNDTLDKKKLNQNSRHYLSELFERSDLCRYELTSRINEMDLFINKHSGLSDRLYQEVINARMRPLYDSVRSIPRLVRDLSRKLKKKVKLEMIGEDTFLDRELLNKLKSPIGHIINNAVDHGIEYPEERVKKGKSEEGVVTLEAQQRAGTFHLVIRDDGGGVDLDLIRTTIIEKELATPDLVEKMSKEEIIDFLYLPNFSSVKEVTSISGRGVGLDIVFTVMQEVGGSVNLITEKDKGTAVDIQMPLSLSVVRVLLVEIGREPYALPLGKIEQILIYPLNEINVSEGRQFIHYEGKNIGIVAAEQVLELPIVTTESSQAYIVLLSDNKKEYGLVVNKFLGERELVVQDFEKSLGKVSDVVAGGLMEDGKPLLILDTAMLLTSIETLHNLGSIKRIFNRKKKSEKEIKRKILLIEDSLTVRTMEKRLLEDNGYEVEEAVNGIEAWNKLKINMYDLIITDIDMPKMNGIELIQLIKSQKYTKDIPIIVVSYKDRGEDRRAGLEAGATYYFTKASFKDRTMIETVNSLLSPVTSQSGDR